MSDEIKIDSFQNCNPAIIFSSTEENYTVEKNGEKPNTVRERTAEAIVKNKAQIEDGLLYVQGVRIKQIQITKEGSEDTFCRVLTNVSVYKNLLIFSWRHYD